MSFPVRYPLHTTFAPSIVQRPTESQLSEVSPKETVFPLCLCSIQNAFATLVSTGDKMTSRDVLISHLIKGQTQPVCHPFSSCTQCLLWLVPTQLIGDCGLRLVCLEFNLQTTTFLLTSSSMKLAFKSNFLSMVREDGEDQLR